MIRYLRPGDWLVLFFGIVFTGYLFKETWSPGRAEKALIRRGGEVFLEANLDRDRAIDVPGPLGSSTILISKGLVRVAKDPSPRQYCVKQGWLKSAGDIAVCLPNQVSVELEGGRRKYDSLSY